LPANFPFPIAFTYSLIGAGRDPAARYERLLRCYEAIVRYCATVQISDYLSSGCPDPDLNRMLLERLSRPLALGHWIELTRRITALQKRGGGPAFMPEMADFYFRGRSTSLTPAAEIFDVTLGAARNAWAHPDHTWPADAYARNFQEHKPMLDELLTALAFLERYKLLVPFRGSRPDVVSEALVLMGPSEHPQVATDLNLSLSPAVREHLEYETTAFLASEADSTRQLLLHPLSLFANRDGAEDVFLFEGCKLDDRAIRKLSYRGVRIGQKPLEMTPGSEYARVVDAFQTVVGALGLGRTAAAATAAPAIDVSDLYFSAQRTLIEEHTRGFVGRADVGTALDHFVASHPHGYFIVRAGPGQGKSAVSSHLVKARGLVHHFISRTGGRSDARLILRSLIAQLVPIAQPAGRAIPDTTAELTKTIEDLLPGAARTQSPFVIVVDALDELPAGPELQTPFLVTEALPAGVFVVVTSRPGDHLDRLSERLTGVPSQIFDLGPLRPDEMREILLRRRNTLSHADVARIVQAAQGNPLYLRAVADELERDPSFDVRELPAGVEGLFSRSIGELSGRQTLRDVLGALAAARQPLSIRELSQITGARQRQVHEDGIRPIRQFLVEVDGGYAFYHARFHDFVTHELLFADELPDHHRAIADWLMRPESRAYEYRATSLAYHLFEAGDRDRLVTTIDRAFLAEKVRRSGYAVLEDVEILTRAMLDAGDAALVERCVALVDGLREVVGGDVIEDTRRAVQSFQAGAGRSRIISPRVPAVPGLDVYVGMLPKVEVSADFIEIVPSGNRLAIAIGDAPATGLKSAFVARFIGSLFRRLVLDSSQVHLGDLMATLDRTISAHPYFERVSMQCVELDPAAGLMKLASAGHPYPVLYSARREKCDRLPLRGDLLHARFAGDPLPHFEQRRAEIAPGDVLVLVTDGLTEGHLLQGDPYSYRFMRIIEAAPRGGARAIGEAILDDWQNHHREGDYADDVTVIVTAIV
jgi:stage II sporulation SpoE-like protein